MTLHPSLSATLSTSPAVAPSRATTTIPPPTVHLATAKYLKQRNFLNIRDSWSLALCSSSPNAVPALIAQSHYAAQLRPVGGLYANDETFTEERQ